METLSPRHPASAGWLLTCVLAMHATGAALPANAQTTPPRRVQAPHTIVELIVDRQVDASVREVWLGLRFELEQGWHVYWQNPGDSGGPPTALWRPAPGVTLGDFEWPVPERITVATIVNYGYTNEVVLPFLVRVAKPIAKGNEVRVSGDLRWLVCHDICVPGKATLSVSLPLNDTDGARLTTWRSQIEQARQLVPKPAPAAWSSRATADPKSFTLTIQLDRAAGPATFFPLEVSQINDSAAQQVTPTGRQLTIKLAKAGQLTSDPRVLRGVLALASGGAFVIEAPIGTSPSRSPAGR
jgi:thiol:disulfide interchange protein DsbD